MLRSPDDILPHVTQDLPCHALARLRRLLNLLHDLTGHGLETHVLAVQHSRGCVDVRVVSRGSGNNSRHEDLSLLVITLQYTNVLGECTDVSASVS
jgi:hypothetical protein